MYIYIHITCALLASVSFSRARSLSLSLSRARILSLYICIYKYEVSFVALAATQSLQALGECKKKGENKKRTSCNMLYLSDTLSFMLYLLYFSDIGVGTGQA